MEETTVDSLYAGLKIGSGIEITEGDMQDIIEQEKLEEAFLDEFAAGNYTIEQPYVKVNPYNVNMLSAYVMFCTNKKGKISLKVRGDVPVYHSFDEYNTEHIIPVLGLYAGKLNDVEFCCIYEDCTEEKSIVRIQTEQIPSEWTLNDKFTVKKIETDKFYFARGVDRNLGVCNSHCMMAFDINGCIRLFQTSYFEYTLLSNGNLLQASRHYNNIDHIRHMQESDLMGKTLKRYVIPYGIHHFIYELPNENFLVTTCDNYSDYVEDTVIEIDRNTGEIVDTIDLKNIIDKERQGFILASNKDWFHNNFIWYEPKSNTLVLSGRHQGIVALDKTTKEIKWILSDPENWKEEYRKYLLYPANTKTEYVYGQHSVMLDENCHLLLFDNGNFRSVNKENLTPAYKNYSRVVEFKIDAEQKIFEQIWQYGKELKEEFLSFAGGLMFKENETGNIFTSAAVVCKDLYGNPTDVPNNAEFSSKIVEIGLNKKIFGDGYKSELLMRLDTNFVMTTHDKRYIYPNNFKLSDIWLNKKAIVLFDSNYYNFKNKAKIPLGMGFKTCITVTNTSEHTIEIDNLDLSYHILNEDRSVIHFEGARCSVSPILSQKQKNYFITIEEIPIKKGNYILQFELVNEGVAWLASRGISVFEIELEVYNPMPKFATRFKTIDELTEFHQSKPLKHMVFLPTLRCNYQCVMYPQTDFINRKNDEIPLQNILKNIDESVYLSCIDTIDITGGEVFLVDGVEDFLLGLEKRGIYCSITTNGYFTERILAFCRKIQDKNSFNFSVSLDGPEEIHNNIRKIKDGYHHTMNTLKGLKELGIPCCVNTVMLESNIDFLPEWKKIISEMGLRHNFIPLLNNGSNEISFSDSDITKFIPFVNNRFDQKYILSRGTFKITNCHAGLQSCTVDPYGNIFTCQPGMYRMMAENNNNEYCIGNLKESDFDSIWSSSKDTKDAVKNCSGCYVGCEVPREVMHFGLSTHIKKEEVALLKTFLQNTSRLDKYSCYGSDSWHEIENPGTDNSQRWMRQKNASIFLCSKTPNLVHAVEIEYMSSLPDYEQTLQISINDIQVGNILCCNGKHRIALLIKDIQNINILDGVFVVTVTTNKLWSPSIYFHSDDMRELGLCISYVGLLQN